MNKSVILIIICAISFSCSKPEGSSSGVSKFEFFSQSPIFPKVQKSLCDSYHNQSYANTNLSAILNGARKSIEIFQGDYKIFSNNIVSAPFSKSIAGYKRDIDIEFTYNPSSSRADKDGYTVKVNRNIRSDGTNAKVCPELTQIEPNTVENATLLVHYSINKTYSALSQNGISLSKIAFKIAPYMQRKQKISGGPFDRPEYQFKGGVKTDNASYNSENQEIVFLPQSKEGIKAGLFGGIPLWEIPMVASHEYGHHAFNSIMSNYQDKRKETSAHLCFDNQVDKNFASNDQSSKLTIDDMMGALNEGFADLVSYYSLSSAEASLKNITCMEESRDISFDHFKDKTKKEFSVEVIAIMTGKKYVQPSRRCHIPDFTEIHDLGAVFASITDKLFNKSNLNKSEKMSLLIKWLKRLNDDFSSNFSSTGIEEGFQAAYELLAKVLVDSGYESDSKELCQFIESKFASMDSSYNWKYLEGCF